MAHHEQLPNELRKKIRTITERNPPFFGTEIEALAYGWKDIDSLAENREYHYDRSAHDIWGSPHAHAAGRLDQPGFQRLVAEVGFGHIGLVLGIEVSRPARSCRDWYQLLEMCALFNTLIGDADGIYDPASTTIACCSA